MFIRIAAKRDLLSVLFGLAWLWVMAGIFAPVAVARGTAAAVTPAAQGSANPAAREAYERSEQRGTPQARISALDQAIRLDPRYAQAFAARSLALSTYARQYAMSLSARDATYSKAIADGLRAVALAPGAGESHAALALAYEGSLDFSRAGEQYERASRSLPQDVGVLEFYGRFAASMGRMDEGIAAARQAVALDPRHAVAHAVLGETLYLQRHYAEAVAALQSSLNLESDDPGAAAQLGMAYYELGDYSKASALCRTADYAWQGVVCLAMTYNKLGRQADATAMLAKFRALNGARAAYQYAQIYSQWGDTRTALRWLKAASLGRDPELVRMKMDPLLDPVREAARFRSIERSLKLTI